MKVKFDRIVHFCYDHKMILACLLFAFAFIGLNETICGAEYKISQVPESVRKYMEISYVFGDNMIGFARGMGQWCYDLLSFFLDPLAKGFSALATWDIFSLKPLKSLNMDLNHLVKVLIPICLCFCTILKLLNLKNPLIILYNGVLTVLAISIFLSVMGIGANLKNVMIKEIDGINKITYNAKLSESLFKKNTVDIAKSIETKKVWHLSDYEDIDIDKISNSAVLSKDIINTRYAYVKDVVREVKLNDGIGGIGDERYYAYTIDYKAINLTMLPMIVIYLVSIYKLAYIIGEWMKIWTTGGLFMLKGFNDTKSIGKVYMSGFNNLIAICIVYFGMMFFSIISQAIISENPFKNWIISALVIFAVGMALIAGSGFFNDVLGIDDGSKFMMKSMFMGHRLKKMGTSALKTAGTVAGAGMVGSAMLGAYVGDKMASAVQKSAMRRNNETMSDIKEAMNKANSQPMLENKPDMITHDEPLGLEDNYSSDGKINPLDNVKYEADENGVIKPVSNRAEQFEDYRKQLYENEPEHTRKNSGSFDTASPNMKYPKSNADSHKPNDFKQRYTSSDVNDTSSNDTSNNSIDTNNDKQTVNNDIANSMNKINDDKNARTQKADERLEQQRKRDYANSSNDILNDDKSFNDFSDIQPQSSINDYSNDIKNKMNEVNEDKTKVEFEDKEAFIPKENYKSVDEFAQAVRNNNKENYTNRELAEMYNKYQKSTATNENSANELEELYNNLHEELGDVSVDNSVGEKDPWFDEMRRKTNRTGTYYQNYGKRGNNGNGNNTKR